jgi:hypothetical protein
MKATIKDNNGEDVRFGVFQHKVTPIDGREVKRWSDFSGEDGHDERFG